MLSGKTVLGIFVWLILIGGLTWWDSAQWRHQSPAPGEYQQETADDEQTASEGGQNVPWLFDFFLPGGQRAVAAYCAEAPEDERQKWFKNFWCEISFADFWIAVGTILVFVATLILGFIAWRQIFTTRQQLRAYLGITAINVDAYVIGNKPALRFEIKNFGETPAYQVVSWNEIKCLSHPLDGDMPTLPFEGAKRVLNPGDHLTVISRADFNVTQSIDAAITADTMRLYLFGQVRYRDAFGRQRLTTYRSHYYPTLKTMIVSEEGNDAD